MDITPDFHWKMQLHIFDIYLHGGFFFRVLEVNLRFFAETNLAVISRSVGSGIS